MIPAGEADYLVIVSPDQVDNNLPALKPGGVLIRPEMVDQNQLANKKSLNVALLGILSTYLPIPQETWLGTIRAGFTESLYSANEQAFHLGRSIKN